jgi:simple sugar transport system ATP-binding protein
MKSTPIQNNLEDLHPIIKFEHHSKHFPQVVANDDISFNIRHGEVHCLLGENGAGKTTLAECLYGFYKPTSGTIYLDGKALSLNSPKDAIDAGIGMVHQHFVLAEPMTVVENIIVGTEIKGISLNLDRAAEKIKNLCQKYGVDLDPFAVVSELSVGQQQWVEILKALYSGVKLLILDEPTAVLTPQETENLFLIIRKMTQEGFSILLITHKLHEVMRVSDRVTVLRKGKWVATVNTNEVTKEELTRMMVGRYVAFKVEKENLKPGKPVLEIKDVYFEKKDCLESLCGFSLTVREHEIMGLAGVAGNGQKELFDVIVGVETVKDGQILLAGEDITNNTPLETSMKGLASIPQDRIHQGLLMNFTVEENLILGLQRTPAFNHYGFLNQPSIANFAQDSIQNYDIATPSPSQIAKVLSGGNLQKIILARELSQKPKCVIASSPTRGLDVGAMKFVHNRLVELRQEGVGVLLISEDLDEIFNVSDRIAVIFRGSVMGIFDINEVDMEKIGLLMAGVQEDA